jgi:hypothetical protein
MDRWWVSPVDVALGREALGPSNRWYERVQTPDFQVAELPEQRSGPGSQDPGGLHAPAPHGTADQATTPARLPAQLSARPGWPSSQP